MWGKCSHSYNSSYQWTTAAEAAETSAGELLNLLSVRRGLWTERSVLKMFRWVTSLWSICLFTAGSTCIWMSSLLRVKIDFKLHAFTLEEEERTGREIWLDCSDKFILGLLSWHFMRQKVGPSASNIFAKRFTKTCVQRHLQNCCCMRFRVRVDASTIFFNYCSSICFISHPKSFCTVT